MVSSDLVDFAQDAGVMEWQSLFVVGWVGRVRTAIMAQEIIGCMLCAVPNWVSLFASSTLIAIQESLLL